MVSRAGIEIVPERITEARAARQYNISDLAQLIGVTRQAISRYEQGANMPSREIIERISEKLGFPIDFFFKENDMCSPLESAVFFRSRKTSEAKTRSMIKVKCNWTYEVYRYLNQYVKLPVFKLPNMDFIIGKDVLSDKDIEFAAMTIRQYWKLGEGPIDNIVSVLERNGIVITNSATVCVKADACSFVKNGVPVVFLGSGNKSSCRVRFSLAHELGHILLHSYIDADDLANPEIAKRIEKEADKFAGAFLMPEGAFAEDVKSLSLKFLIMLKRKWKVSLGAMVYRCKTLGLIDEDQSLYLNKQISQNKWRTVEPLDDEIPFEAARLFKKALDLMFENEVISVGSFIRKFCLNANDLADVCGCPTNYFEKSPEPDVKLRLV